MRFSVNVLLICILYCDARSGCLIRTVCKYSGIPISRTSRGNSNWFEKSGVREIEGGIKLRLIGGYCLVMSKC